MKKICISLIFCLLFINASYAASGTAVCSNGIFTGTENEGVISWKGVPYAKAPIGNLRWKAPEAPDNSSNEYSADKYAYIPLQGKSAANPGSYGQTSEDCLYLNVWKSGTDTSTSRPVVVWIFGGGYDSGATSNYYYEGDEFVKNNPDIIFVSIAYRVGIMGFIDFSQVSGGENYPDSTNLGLLDMLQALRWIKANISAFGGDNNNITLMGQSAGAGAISLLMTIPESRELFQRAILESGTVSLSMRKADAFELTEKLLEVTGKSDMAGLNSLTAEELTAAIENKAVSSLTNFPILDGRILSEDIYKAFAENAGKFDMLIGSNADELNFWKSNFTLGAETFNKLIPNSFVMIQEAIEKYSVDDVALTEDFAYLVSDDYAEFFNDLYFRGPAIAQAEINSRVNTGKTFMYYWEHPANGFFDGCGACHCAETGYFIHKNHLVTLTLDEQLVNNFNPLIANFIRTGNPSTASTVWPEYNAQTRQTLIVTETGTLMTENAPLDDQRAIIMPLLKWGISGREMIHNNIDNGISVDPDALKRQVLPTDDDEFGGGDDAEEDEKTEDKKVEDKETSEKVGSSKGGCNSGISIGSLFIVAALIIRKKRS